jgi:hypothetical protein
MLDFLRKKMGFGDGWGTWRTQLGRRGGGGGGGNPRSICQSLTIT